MNILFQTKQSEIRIQLRIITNNPSSEIDIQNSIS